MIGLLIAGILQLAPGATPVERYYEAIASPDVFAPRQTRVLDRPPTLPKLPDSLRLERGWQTGHKCGPVALYFMLNLNGIHTSLDDTLAKVPIIAGKGASIESLRQAAAEFGLETEVVQVSPQQFLSLPKGSIVHWNTIASADQANNHFDVLVGYVGADKYLIIDTTNCITTTVSQDVATQRSSGYALIKRDMRRNVPLWLLWSIFGFVATVDVILAGASLLGAAKSRRLGQNSSHLQ
jgi:predicted double-glycine peptidase